jgi:hypothetical protein
MRRGATGDDPMATMGTESERRAYGKTMSITGTLYGNPMAGDGQCKLGFSPKMRETTSAVSLHVG